MIFAISLLLGIILSVPERALNGTYSASTFPQAVAGSCDDIEIGRGPWNIFSLLALYLWHESCLRAHKMSHDMAMADKSEG